MTNFKSRNRVSRIKNRSKFKTRKSTFGSTKKRIKRQSFSVRQKSQEIQKIQINIKDIWQNLQSLKWLLLPFFPIFWLINGIFYIFKKNFDQPELVVKISLSLVFVTTIFHFAMLQVESFASFVNGSNLGENAFIQNLQQRSEVRTIASNVSIAKSTKGQIFIEDNASNSTTSLTSIKTQQNLFFDPDNLKKQVEFDLDLRDVAFRLSSSLNIDFNQIYNKIKLETNKEKPDKYSILYKDLNPKQVEVIRFLRTSDIEEVDRYNYDFWLDIEQRQTISYPKGELFASSLGYTPNYEVNNIEIEQRFAECRQMVLQNQQRGTDTNAYQVGSYGLQQKFCSELNGLNGIQFDDDLKKQDGADIFLTIDKNLQREAEKILKSAVEVNTGNQGAPNDGTIIILEAKTGKIKAMASWPTYDPNNYQEYWDPNSEKYNPNAFRNVATNVDHAPGSVIKPLTLLAGRTVYKNNIVEFDNRRGVPDNYHFLDYGPEGKIYQELGSDGQRITNANLRSYQSMGRIPVADCIRDSINTCIADIVEMTGRTQLRDFFLENYRFGQETVVDLPGDEHGNVRPFDTEIGCPFCYANFGFGQGFSISPLQLARAYTVFANQGQIVEPYLVDRIEYSDGTVDTGNSFSSKLARPKKELVADPAAVDEVMDSMVSVIDGGFLGQDPLPARSDKYVLAGKTGTAELERPIPQLDANGEVLLDKNGDPILEVPCKGCSKARGLYDHTFIGLGPVSEPEYIVLVKLAEPRRGEVNNFSSATVTPFFKEMMEYTLQYYGIPGDR